MKAKRIPTIDDVRMRGEEFDKIIGRARQAHPVPPAKPKTKAKATGA